MTNMKATTIAAAGFGALSMFALAGAALSQEGTPSGAPPAWATLVRCAEIADDDASLACFKAAMRAAGYAPKPEAVAEEHRHRFGLSVPKLGALRRHAKEEGARSAAAGGAAPEQVKPEQSEDSATVTLAQVATLYDGKLLFVTTDGAIWEQLDDVTVQPKPKAGMTMLIRRGRIGGYFCDASKWKSVRCQRTH